MFQIQPYLLETFQMLDKAFQHTGTRGGGLWGNT